MLFFPRKFESCIYKLVEPVIGVAVVRDPGLIAREEILWIKISPHINVFARRILDQLPSNVLAVPLASWNVTIRLPPRVWRVSVEGARRAVRHRRCRDKP